MTARQKPELRSHAVNERLAAFGTVDITEDNQAEPEDPQRLRKGALAGHQLLAALQQERESETRRDGRSLPGRGCAAGSRRRTG